MTGWDDEIIKGYLKYYNRYPDEAGYANFDKSDLHGDKLLQAILGASAADKDGIDFKRAVKRGYNPLDPIAKFANGGSFGGGLRMVGEAGAELEVTGASRIISNQEIFSRLQNPQQNNAVLVAAVDRLTKQVERLQAAASQTAANTGETARTLDNITRESGGDAVKVQVAA